MTKQTLTNDAERMEQIMCKTAEPCDIWQDRFIYWIAVAIYHILRWIMKQDKATAETVKPDLTDEIQISISDLAERDPGVIRTY